MKLIVTGRNSVVRLIVELYANSPTVSEVDQHGVCIEFYMRGLPGTTMSGVSAWTAILLAPNPKGGVGGLMYHIRFLMTTELQMGMTMHSLDI